MLDADSVEIVVAPVVIAELDKKKNEGTQRIRQRARDALQRIKETLDRATSRGTLRENVTLQYIAREPSLDFAAWGLSPGHADDRLIATIIEYTRAHPSASVLVVTDDTGLTLKSASRALVVKEMPEDQRLKDEPHAQELENQRLKATLAEYENRLPRLRVVFGPGEDHRRFVLRPALSASLDEIAARVQELKKKHQPYKKAEVRRDLLAGIGSLLHQVSDEEIRRYNDALPGFFAEMEKYWAASVEIENRIRRSLQLELWVENYGTAPGRALLVLLHFPDGMVVSDEEHRPTMPREPKVPVPPRTQMELMSTSPQLLGMFPGTNFTIPDIPLRGNVSAPMIRRTNSFEVRFEIEKAPHNLLIAFDPLCIVFDSWESARSFPIEWVIYTDSLPRPTEGRCHVIVEHAKPVTQ